MEDNALPAMVAPMIVASSPEELQALLVRDYGVERIRSYRASCR